MVSYSQVKNGIVQYLDAEMLSKLNGWQKWTMGAAMGIVIEKGVDVFNTIKSNSFVQSLNVIDANDMIDIDLIHKHFAEQAAKSAITFKLPIIGDVTLNSSDVDKLYTIILQQ